MKKMQIKNNYVFLIMFLMVAVYAEGSVADATSKDSTGHGDLVQCKKLLQKTYGDLKGKDAKKILKAAESLCGPDSKNN